jgi:Fe-S-cluster containining protein
MKLPIIENPAGVQPWYGQGLRFTCSQCGNCCSGGPGYVFISRLELTRLAEFLQKPRRDVIREYCRKVGSRYALKEIRHPRHGGYDCVFIKEIPADTSAAADKVVQSKRICSIYPVRPLQCRTWPFWEGNLSSQRAWQRAGKTCHGIDRGELFDRARIEKLRDARRWPTKPPTSDADEQSQRGWPTARRSGN